MRTTAHFPIAIPIILTYCTAFCFAQDSAILKVDPGKVLHPISPTLHGIFFEDINFAADGGLYPERVKNGSFEFTPDPLLGWHRAEASSTTGEVAIATDDPLNASNLHYLKLTIFNKDSSTTKQAGYGLSNDGFRGMGISSGSKYTFSVYSRTAGSDPVTLDVRLQDSHDKPIGAVSITITGNQWKKYSADIQATDTDAHAHLLVVSNTPGSMDLDMVSLYPQDTYARPRGLRPDLVQLLKDLHPKFVRFPGGCIVEGRTLENRYQWKTTIGDVSQRKVNLNRWNTEFNWRPTPDYFQSYGLGFYEFFQLCEDVGAGPLPILNCGMACQYNTGQLVPMSQLNPYVQDALDLIEFANGPADSTWGKKRAAMGHPAPFNLKRLGVGNEQWGPRYIERYTQFAKAIKAKYPEIEFVAAAGPSPDGALFHYAWEQLSALHADVLDEHYYASPDWFIKNTGRYDHYPRTGPKVFAGEFAAQSSGIAKPDNQNNWRCALSEAAFMTGLERNSDLVVMSSYAPLFAHVDAWQWTPNLIWFDNLKSFGTPNYYVQQLFGANTGTVLLDSQLSGQTAGLFVTGSRDDASGDLIIKIVNVDEKPRQIKLQIAGLTDTATADEQVLATSDLETVNSLTEPTKLAPVTKPLGKMTADSEQEIPGSSLTVIRIHK